MRQHLRDGVDTANLRRVGSRTSRAGQLFRGLSNANVVIDARGALARALDDAGVAFLGLAQRLNGGVPR